MSENSENDSDTRFRQKSSVDLGVTLEAFIDHIMKLTGYSIEELITQIICTTYPEVSDNLLNHSYFDDRSTIPMWFHLDSSDFENLQNIKNKYVNRHSDMEIIDQLLLIGWQSIGKGRFSDQFDMTSN